MKNQNKYANLANGLALYALNNSSIIFSALSLYGLFSIRKFTISEDDYNLKSLTETLMVFVLLRTIIETIALYNNTLYLSHTVVLINTILFIISIFVINNTFNYLKIILDNYDLKHLSNKLKNSTKAIIIIDGILVSILLLILLVATFNIVSLVGLLSLFLNPSINFAIGIIFLIFKYFISKNFTNATLILRQLDVDIE